MNPIVPNPIPILARSGVRVPHLPGALSDLQTGVYELLSKLLKGGYIGDYIGGTTIGVIKGDTRSLDSISYGP